MCYSLLNSQNISVNNSEKRLFNKKPRQKATEVAQKRNNNWPMVSFILNGTEKTTGMGFSLKRKRAKSKVKFLMSISSESQAADHYISTRAPQFYANLLKQLFF